ncbi:response regulator with CheY-like receiver domain and winged-helix DNA-binding domain protein [Rheinheimera sp. A13L]|uniref:response regulator transcription factor n=1 Tax=Rheinheimera sp. A13L TaxID=506534 RepID=UPI0002125052|nr:response regulator transcription factor [Rheinheimera sp. A13L]EGM76011.1 response regulator with CheY-like receiver domain and winged-helix DNA-binding domain protein [Rheinheimera sp. A13L]
MDASRILIIEDDLTLSAQVAELLQGKGFKTQQCQDGEQGLVAALQQNFDLILLGVLQPDMNGFSILEQLRKVKQTPVMMVTAQGAEQERIQGYSSGADDCLSKPFNFTELLVRIEALLRRSFGYSKPSVPGNSLKVDQIQLNRSTQQAEFAGTRLSFTPVQFKLLWVLLQNKQQVLSKPLLYQTVLGRPFSRCDRSLDMHMSRVRKKLEEAGMQPDRLVTVHGKGYCFA